MKTVEYSTINKSEWGEGAWQSEPDKRQWQDPATGLPCLIVRVPHSGHLCGYVGVPDGHPAFEKGYDEVHGEYDYDASEYKDAVVPDLEVHGGLTFAGLCRPEAEETGICHTVEPGEDDRVWWLGFDCAHAWDFCPATRARYKGDPVFDPMEGESYKDVAYVTEEVTKLAAQLKAVA